MRTPDAAVPCGGCKVCCVNENVPVLPEDGDPAAYLTRDAPPGLLATFDFLAVFDAPVSKFLAQRPNGECVYLGDTGCTIYPRRPSICRTFDCGAMFRTLSRAERKRRVKLGLANPPIYDRGREIEAIRHAAQQRRRTDESRSRSPCGVPGTQESASLGEKADSGGPRVP